MPPVVAPLNPPESKKLSILRARSARDRSPKPLARLNQVESVVVKTAISYIDATFKNAPTRTSKVMLVSRMHGANGSFDPATKDIRVSLQGNEGDPLRMAMTLVHEWGHSLDDGLGAKYGQQWGSKAVASPEAARWLTLVQNSPSFLALKRRGGRYGSYFTTTHECFARCMEMMMAKRLGGEMIKSLDAKRAYWLAGDSYTAYWEWSEFEPILDAFEKWLAAEGVLQ